MSTVRAIPNVSTPLFPPTLIPKTVLENSGNSYGTIIVIVIFVIVIAVIIIIAVIVIKKNTDDSKNTVEKNVMDNDEPFNDEVETFLPYNSRFTNRDSDYSKQIMEDDVESAIGYSTDGDDDDDEVDKIENKDHDHADDTESMDEAVNLLRTYNESSSDDYDNDDVNEKNTIARF